MGGTAGPVRRVTGGPDDGWIDSEPRLFEVARHVATRALHRPLLIVAISLGMTVMALGIRLRQPTSYTASASIRVVEGVRSAQTPTAPARLRDDIASRAFSRARLAALLAKYDLADPDDMTKLDELKDSIDVTVAENYFLPGYADEGPRSALITLSYAAGSAEVAQGVVHDIAGAVAVEQQQARQARVAMAREEIADVSGRVRERIAELDDDTRIAARQLDGGSDDGAIRARIATNELQKRSLEQRMATLNKLQTEVDVAATAEQLGIGLSLELVDEDMDVAGLPLSPAALIERAAALFALSLPISFLLIGAFDRRIYNAHDVVRLGVRLAGVLPAFDGSRVGSPADRRRRIRV
jgi:hypothetical protein